VHALSMYKNKKITKKSHNIADKEAWPEAGGSSICLLLQVVAYCILMHVDISTLYIMYVVCSLLWLNEQIMRIVLLYDTYRYVFSYLRRPRDPMSCSISRDILNIANKNILLYTLCNVYERISKHFFSAKMLIILKNYCGCP